MQNALRKIILFRSFLILFLKRYYNKETIVREQIRPTSDGVYDVNVPFIDFILCPTVDSAYKGEVLRKYGLTIHDNIKQSTNCASKHPLKTSSSAIVRTSCQKGYIDYIFNGRS